MKLYEFEGIDLFRREGIPVSDYVLAANSEEARQKAQEMGLPVVIKAQVLAGGRYLAGGVQIAESLDQVAEITHHILSLSISGFPVQQVMLVPKVETVREYYLGVTVDEYRGTPVAILSADGGVSINEIAMEHPELVFTRHVPITTGLSRYEAQQIAREVGLRG
ncbi:MAG: acetate--CoA ligase family protein, partial [Dehalococcoidia bacterium]|nr:acetate--CoA ligase family protein [Dehalococcoidia bacterium]